MRKVLLFIATTALVAGMTGIASAESFTATSLVQENNGNCGKYVGGSAIIGNAKFTRTFNKLKVVYTAKHLAKSTRYELDFYNDTAGICEFIGNPASFVTTATGAGKGTGEMEVAEGDYEFFADGVSTGGAPFGNDSFTVTLPRP
jgi:hypothetical protein